MAQRTARVFDSLSRRIGVGTSVLCLTMSHWCCSDSSNFVLTDAVCDLVLCILVPHNGNENVICSESPL